jgi:hypothetical protein
MRRFAPVLMATLVGCVKVAHAQYVVFDAANTAQAALAVKNIKDQIESFKAYRDQFMAYRQVFDGYKAEFEQYRGIVRDFQDWRGKFDRKKLKSLGEQAIEALAKDMGVEVGILRSVYQSARETHGNLSRLNLLYRDFEQAAGFANMSASDFWRYERDRLRLHRTADRSYYANLAQTVQQVQMDIAKLNLLRQAIPQTSDNEGATSLRAVMEVSASHLNLMANQNAQLYSMLGEGFLLQQAAASSEKSSLEAISARARTTLAQEWNLADTAAHAACLKLRRAHGRIDLPCPGRQSTPPVTP